MNPARTRINWSFDGKAARRKFGHKEQSFNPSENPTRNTMVK